MYINKANRVYVLKANGRRITIAPWQKRDIPKEFHQDATFRMAVDAGDLVEINAPGQMPSALDVAARDALAEQAAMKDAEAAGEEVLPEAEPEAESAAEPAAPKKSSRKKADAE